MEEGTAVPEFSDDDLLKALGVDTEVRQTGSYSVREARIIAGFEDIQRFVEQHGHAPQHGEDHDIFERLYAVRLDRLRALSEYRSLLEPMDTHGLLSADALSQVETVAAMDDDALLAELAGEEGVPITELRHVRPRVEIRAAEEVAQQVKCKDFDQFRPLFDQTEDELRAGVRQTRPFGQDIQMYPGDFFVLRGQLVYVAAMGAIFHTPNGEPDARLRVIYANGTESNLLLRSLQRALYKDEAGRRVSKPHTAQFSDTWNDGDMESGTIYILRSRSKEPFIAEHREMIHKIGVTGGKVETRIANAEHEATYLLAEVEVVATYKLASINRTKLERLLHRVFAAAQLDLTIRDRFDQPVHPEEWFFVPLHVIDEGVERIRDGSITEVVYDPKSARLVSRG